MAETEKKHYLKYKANIYKDSNNGFTKYKTYIYKDGAYVLVKPCIYTDIDVAIAGLAVAGVSRAAE